MDSVYRQQFDVNFSAVDRYGRLRPANLLFYCQDIAGAHCTSEGLGWEILAQKRLFWAIIRQKVQITRLPMAGETISVETWAMPTTKVSFPRSTVAYDQAGRELFRAIGLWVLMDLDTRAMILPGKSGITVRGATLGGELPPPGSLIPRPLGSHFQRKVCFTDLDRNGHMNNTRYLDWMDDLLPSAFHQNHPAKEFTVCYLAEAREGQTLDLSWELSPEGLLQVDAHRTAPDGHPERVFAARVQY